MGEITTKIDYSKISQYLKGIIHLVKKLEIEMDKGLMQSLRDSEEEDESLSKTS